MGGWKVRLPLYAAGLATGGAFGVLFTGGAMPYLLGAALVALLVGSSGTYRFLLLFPAAALYTLVAVYGTLPLSPSGWRELFVRVGRDVYEGAAVSYATPVPYDPHPGLLVVLLPVIVIVVAFATSATIYEESPVVSVAVLGLTIGTLSTISFEAGIGPFFAVFLVSGVCLLLLAGDRTEWGARLAPAAVVAGVLVAGVVLALPEAPFAEEAIRPAQIDWTRIATGGTSRLAVQADVGDYLTKGRDAELMRIKSPEPMLWRGGTLDHFDGVRWSSTVDSGEDELLGEEVSDNVPTRKVIQEVKVLQAETSLLFGGYKVSNVSIPYATEHSDGSWTSASPLTEDSSYRMLSRIPQPSAAQLETAGADYPALVREKFLQLPEDRPEVLAETARKIQEDYAPQTPYDTARAIERYLAHDGGFTYNIGADYTRADKAIEEFLGGDREGFCTQFATSMALLSRELGIPSRVVYGATAGKEEEPGEYVVTGYNMHTWVEVYFPGVGWYPFDPTPGFSVPSVMQENAPRPKTNDLSYVSSEAPALKVRQPSDPGQIEASTGEGPKTSAEETPGLGWHAYALLSVLLVLLFLAVVPLVKRALVARGRPEDLYRDLTGRLRDVLPFTSGAGSKVADSPALTPTERLLLLAGAAGIEAGPFREFARAYSESLYAPDPSSNTGRAYRKALLEYEKLPGWRRALGTANPSSLLRRARRRLAAYGGWLGKVLRTKMRVLKTFRRGRPGGDQR